MLDSYSQARYLTRVDERDAHPCHFSAPDGAPSLSRAEVSLNLGSGPHSFSTSELFI